MKEEKCLSSKKASFLKDFEDRFRENAIFECRLPISENLVKLMLRVASSLTLHLETVLREFQIAYLICVTFPLHAFP